MANSATASLLCTAAFLLSAWSASGGALNVKDFGAIADGRSDAAGAVLAAWAAACFSDGVTAVLVPAGNFLVGPVALRGPCKGPMTFRLEGTVKAPADPAAFSDEYWISFESIDQLTVNGGGTFDGQGATAWSRGGCTGASKCRIPPVSVRFSFVKWATIDGISSIDSKFFHILISDSEHVTAQFLTVTSPADSPNTDGVHITRSSDITVAHSTVRSGDDCVSVGPGAAGLLVVNVTCGPGHGISEDVKNITVKNCTVQGTQNGVRIKTWRSNYASSAYNITFEDVVVKDAANPIIIDQYYCPHLSCNDQPPSRVSISSVNFWNIRGTSATKTAVNLMCSSANPCRDVDLRDVDIYYEAGNKPVCKFSNVNPISSGIMQPACSPSHA
ncbi:unnamed protein product [Spirodela intermedia]|uniref:Exopolygalacturonase n=1 Tax=Spirodela intermedia TaxID=51605 RepID=A0A7I8JHG7_SPIIN|nr:unnamed protein product [Spirodela intermedia]CAA6668993.1 unnamed protein product [Spirodela intermedia]